MADLRKTDVVYITAYALRWEAKIQLCENLQFELVIMIMMMLSMVTMYISLSFYDWLIVVWVGLCWVSYLVGWLGLGR